MEPPHERTQVFTELAIIFIDEYTPAKASWLTWKELMHLMDIVCCAAILFPIVWRIKHLREAAQSDGKAAQCAPRLTALCCACLRRVLQRWRAQRP